MTGFNWADVPAILVEVGFMTNPTEDRALATAAYRERAARGLCRGVMRVLGRVRSRLLTGHRSYLAASKSRTRMRV